MKNKNIHQIFFPFIFGYHWLPQLLLNEYRKTRKWDCEKVFQTLDGDIFRVEIMNPKSKDECVKGNVIVVHGFSSSTNSKYVQNIAFHMRNKGYRVFGYNYRGNCGKMLTSNYVHIGFVADLEQTLKFIKDNYTGNIAIVGYSMGGILTTNLYANIAQFDDRVKFAVAVSMPLNINKAYTFISNHIYRLIVERVMLKRAHDIFKEQKILKRDLYFNSIKELDQYLLRKRGDNSTVEDFYSLNSPIHKIHKIKKPFVTIIAEDDICAPVFAEDKEVFSNSNSLLVLTKLGSHIGFIGNGFYETFAESIILEYLDYFLLNKME